MSPQLRILHAQLLKLRSTLGYPHLDVLPRRRHGDGRRFLQGREGAAPRRRLPSRESGPTSDDSLGSSEPEHLVQRISCGGPCDARLTQNGTQLFITAIGGNVDVDITKSPSNSLSVVANHSTGVMTLSLGIIHRVRQVASRSPRDVRVSRHRVCQVWLTATLAPLRSRKVR